MRNEKLIKLLDSTTLLIARSDGLVMRNKWGMVNIYHINGNDGIEERLEELNNYYREAGYTQRFAAVLVGDYKEKNPGFKF